MHHIYLVIVFCAVFFVHNVFYLRLTETIFDVKCTKLKAFIFSLGSGVIGTVFLEGFGSMSSLGYTIMLGVYTVTVMLYFRKESKIARIACILTFNIHIMVARAIVSSATSLLMGKSIFEISDDPIWFWRVLIMTSMLSAIFTLALIKIVPKKYLRALTQKTEQMYAYVAITAIANTHLIANGMVYVEKNDYIYLIPSQIITAFAWLLVMYVGMFMLVGFDILRDKKESLEKDSFYKNMLINQAVFVAEIDCNKNVVVRAFRYGKLMENFVDTPLVELVFEYIKEKIHPSDVKIVDEYSKSEYILSQRSKGIYEFTYNLRVLKDDGEYRWMRAYVITNLYEDTDDVVAIYTIIDDIHDNIMKEKELKAHAQIDSLVGLYNKATTEELIKKHLKIEQVGALILIDLDNFKGINDNMGHAYGDNVLREIAMKISHNFRKEDIVGRIGGDEFLVYITSRLSKESIMQKVEKICTDVYKTYEGENDVRITVSCSIGIALVPEHGDNFLALYNASDRAMYSSKNSGKNAYTIYDVSKHVDYRVHD